MTEKRYYKKDWEESYYVFDSKTLSESEFEERVEYEGYDVFGDSLTGDEVIDLLNENKQLKFKNRGLQSELEIQKKDVDYSNKFSNELFDKCKRYQKKNEQLKSENKRLKRLTTQYHVIDIEKVLPAIAECKGITVEEYLEEIEEEYTKEGDLE